MVSPEPDGAPPAEEAPASARPPGPATGEALPSPLRPLDATPVHTDDLPPTPTRDRAIPVAAWIEAPASLRTLGDDLPGTPEARYLRRIGPWLLWRAGPPSKGDSRLWAARTTALEDHFTFRLHPDGTGEGTGPSGASHARFRTWKEDLRDAP